MTAEKNSKKRITFKLNNADAGTVNLAGTFNNWDPNARPLKRDTKGLWKTTVMLPSGTHEYRFVADGEWTADPMNTERRTNEFGDDNSIIVVQ